MSSHVSFIYHPPIVGNFELLIIVQNCIPFSLQFFFLNLLSTRASEEIERRKTFITRLAQGDGCYLAWRLKPCLSQKDFVRFANSSSVSLIRTRAVSSSKMSMTALPYLLKRSRKIHSNRRINRNLLPPCVGSTAISFHDLGGLG